jgi:adenosylcobinamide kinase/adenosylcobinamide-phosphate guanylyltransferase
MMILIIGGKYQGKYEFAKSLSLPIINNLENIIKELMNKDIDIQSEIFSLVENKNMAVICNEIGCGIVPLNKEDRDFREITGRILCELAKRADTVYKVEASIATKIKG